jgi:PTS system nitrogen regulatory IIA component
VKICDILKQPLIVPHLQARDKTGVLHELAEHLCAHVAHAGTTGVSADDIATALVTREQLGSTGVGEGVAIPHAKIPGIGQLVAAFGRAPAGVAFDAIDLQPVHLVFVLLVPENSAGAHLKALARISRLLKNGEFRRRLLDTDGAQPIYAAFVEEDEKN